MSGGRAEVVYASLVEMVGAACSMNPRDKSGACGSRDGERDREVGVRGREVLGYRRAKGWRTTRGTI